MEWIEGYSEQLELSYLYDHTRFLFEDGVDYYHYEALPLCRECDDDIRAIHNVKRLFGGSVIPAEK